MLLGLTSAILSYADDTMWSSGVRIIPKTQPEFTTFANECVAGCLKITCPNLSAQASPYVGKILDERLRQRWNTITNDYRKTLTACE